MYTFLGPEKQKKKNRDLRLGNRILQVAPGLLGGMIAKNVPVNVSRYTCLIIVAFSYLPLGSLMNISSFVGPGRLHPSLVLTYLAGVSWEVWLVRQQR